jgi:hypothetical protein
LNFTIPATSKTIIKIVVATIAICAVLTIATLSACVILNVRPDATLLTAYVGITTGSLGALTGLLANTRSTPGTDADMPKATLVPDPPTPVSVVSSVTDPVHTEEAAK